MSTKYLGPTLLAFTLGFVSASAALAAEPGQKQDSPPPVLLLDHGDLFRPAAVGGGDLILLTLAFSPDGKTIASAGGGTAGRREYSAQGELKLWDVATGKALHTIAVERQIVFDAKYSPDGKLLATASGSGTVVPAIPGEIRLWNPVTGQLVRKLQGHKLPSHARGAYVVAFSPDGKLLASGGIATIDENKTVEVRGANATGDLTLWDLATGKPLWTRGGHSGTVGALVFSADGKTVASSGGLSDGQVKLWEVASGTELQSLRFSADVVTLVAFDAKSAMLVVLSYGLAGDEQRLPFTAQLSRWDLIEKKQLAAVDIKNGNAYRLTISHQGDLLACACHDGVRVYDVAKQVELRFLPSKFRMRPVAFSSDDQLLAAGSDDGKVRLWRVRQLRK